VTSAELDPSNCKYKPEHIDRLTEAARDYLKETGAAEGFLFANRMRDWEKPQI
jgi:quinol monooxygenase YgiN